MGMGQRCMRSREFILGFPFSECHKTFIDYRCAHCTFTFRRVTLADNIRWNRPPKMRALSRTNEQRPDEKSFIHVWFACSGHYVCVCEVPQEKWRMRVSELWPLRHWRLQNPELGAGAVRRFIGPSQVPSGLGLLLSVLNIIISPLSLNTHIRRYILR